MANLFHGGLLCSILLLINVINAQMQAAECPCEEGETAKIVTHIDFVLANTTEENRCVTNEDMGKAQEQTMEKLNDILEKVCNISTMLLGNKRERNPLETILDEADNEYKRCFVEALPVLSKWINKDNQTDDMENLPPEVKAVLVVMYCNMDWQYMQRFVRMRRYLVNGKWKKAAEEIRNKTWHRILNKTLVENLAVKLENLKIEQKKTNKKGKGQKVENKIEKLVKKIDKLVNKQERKGNGKKNKDPQ